jgi:integrase
MIVTGKGGNQRTVPLHSKVIDALAMLPPDDEAMYVLPRFDGWKDRHLAPGRVSSMINEYLHSMGIPDTAHSLRHRFGTDVYRASQDIRLTQDLLGHSSPITTAIYAAADVSKAAAIVSGL